MSKQLHNKVNKEILKQQLLGSQEERTTLSFYQYANISNTSFFRDHLYTLLTEIDVYGRIYVASEGINGQISVPNIRMNSLKKCLYDIAFLEGIRLNIAIEDDGKSFYKLDIKIKKKIVADGLNDDAFDVTDRGKHVNAAEFNKLLECEDTLLIDMRNHYESEVGHFEHAICPDVETFRESLPVVEDILDGQYDKNIAMYCTGGIRCEKASAWFKHKGYHNIHQLDGGIIEYSRKVEEQGLENKFKGKNFVFDERLGERISNEVISECHQCGTACDTHVNCINDGCHILFIQCDVCKAKFESTCSMKCRDFIQLPAEERSRLKTSLKFNGTQFGKGRYKALHQHDQLDLD